MDVFLFGSSVYYYTCHLSFLDFHRLFLFQYSKFLAIGYYRVTFSSFIFIKDTVNVPDQMFDLGDPPCKLVHHCQVQQHE